MPALGSVETHRANCMPPLSQESCASGHETVGICLMHFLADADVVSHLRVCQMNNNDMPQHSCIVAVATPTMAEHALMLQSNAPDASALIPDICVM